MRLVTLEDKTSKQPDSGLRELQLLQPELGLIYSIDFYKGAA